MSPHQLLCVCMMSVAVASAQAPISEDTEGCLVCHETLHPGIVADWRASRHASVSPKQALEADAIQRRVSIESATAEWATYAVGCAECHTLRSDQHPDAVEHGGWTMHTVVTPRDCATCHPTEADQFSRNSMAHAHGNLMDNTLYRDLIDAVNGVHHYGAEGLIQDAGTAETNADSCLQCHGTRVEVERIESRETDLGEMDFAVLTGWPNQGVGRINPDGSLGTCSACHTRHQFSIKMARKPETCSQCHKGPDVPAYKVYEVSKHGNIYKSLHADWDMDAVPWTVGEDFTAPTCAACHMSLTVNADGDTLAERTHQVSDRLAWRLFGLPAAHPHPRSPDTSKIRNADGLPLPTQLTGEPAMEYLIDEAEQTQRRGRMTGVCTACHAQAWVDGHFARLEDTIESTNQSTAAASRILIDAWQAGLAQGPPEGSAFDETIERMWVEQWLFYGNSTRFASAMMGADYGVFANGRWKMSANVRAMHDWLVERR